MNYKEYLQSERWKTLREGKLVQARYKCQLCDAKDCELNGHHRSYRNLGKPAEIDDLIVLCKTCHEKYHDIKSPGVNRGQGKPAPLSLGFGILPADLSS